MKLEWQQAPVKTQWGDEMVVASVAIDKDHTLDLYCEREQTQKVETLITQRTWVNATTWRGLTDEEVRKASLRAGMQEHYMGFHSGFIRFADEISAILKEKNTNA